MKKIELNWEYCECGCHGHELNVAGKYWVFNDLGNPPTLYLKNGHKWSGIELGKFKSYKEIDSYIIKELKAEYRKLGKMLNIK